MPKISKRLVDASAPQQKRYYVWDTQLVGFGLQVLPTGVRSYVFQYRDAENRSRRLTIGKHGIWTAEGARAKAQEYAALVAKGGDPLGRKRAARDAITVGQMLDSYLQSEKFAEKAASTQSIDRGRIERHLRPLLGKRVAANVTGEDVRRVFGSIRDGKTAKVEKTGPRGKARVTGGEGTARSAIKLLRSAYSWAVSEHVVPTNPAAGVSVGSDATRDIVMPDAAAYRRLFKALEKAENEKRIRKPAADAIRVIALTGARRGEIANLIWSQVDLKAGLLILPPSSHKTGRKTGEPRVIGLPAAAQAIIAEQKRGEPGDYVFAPAKGQGAISLNKPWVMIREEAVLPEGIGLHGLRHSLATHMAMAGAQAAEIMAAMGHRQMSTAQRYVHYAQDARAALAEKSAKMISGALQEDENRGGKVVPMPGGRVDD